MSGFHGGHESDGEGFHGGASSGRAHGETHPNHRAEYHDAGLGMDILGSAASAMGDIMECKVHVDPVTDAMDARAFHDEESNKKIFRLTLIVSVLFFALCLLLFLLLFTYKTGDKGNEVYSCLLFRYSFAIDEGTMITRNVFAIIIMSIGVICSIVLLCVAFKRKNQAKFYFEVQREKAERAAKEAAKAQKEQEEKSNSFEEVK